ncbi:MAG TPA: hypothetical protein VK926_04565 [Gaiellaceae bacterium]|nr:hypothetical protein [Gaiellaceae bacterium]
MTIPSATPRSRHAARLRARRRRSQAKARWLALAGVVGVLGSVSLLLTAFDDTGGSPVAIPSVSPAPVTSAPPEPKVLATVGNLRIQSPVAQGGVTAVGLRGSAEGPLVLQPVGPQANEGLLARLWHRITGSTRRGLAWYQLESGVLRTLVVGAVAGTDVYAPVDGTVVAIRSRVISGQKVGAEIELRPISAPSLVVSIRNVRSDRELTVGENVVAGSSKLGRVVNVARYERQALADYAADNGNNVSIEVHPSASLAVP